MAPAIEALGLVCAGAWLASLIFHAGSAAAALAHARFRRRRAGATSARPPVSVIVPTRETDPVFRERLAELACLAYPDCEIIVASERAEPAVSAAIAALAPAAARRVRYRIDSARHTLNPKVNVLAAAYGMAAHDLILMTDDNVRTPPDRIDALLPYLAGEVGLVSSIAAGIEPRGLMAEIEASFMNGYGSRALLAADRLGHGIAMGKTLLFRKRDLERAGGILALAHGVAEDSVIRERLAAIGLGTVLAPQPAFQVLGRRRFAEIFARQLRWMAARRWHAPLAFWTELAQGFALAGLAGGFAVAILFGGSFVLGLAGTWLAWLALDLACTRAFAWPASWRYPLAWTLRELLLPLMWVMALTKRSVAWRGNALPLRPRLPALGEERRSGPR